MENLIESYHKFANQIHAFPTDEAKQIAFLIYEHYFGLSKNMLILGSDLKVVFPEEILRRVNTSEPVQYILGQTSFCDLIFEVSPAVLIPRPETEELVFSCLKHKPTSILDLCTGSGCIAISLAVLCPDCKVWAVDVSKEALNLARRNAVLNNAEVLFKESDLLLPFLIDGKYDLIISNPPYVLDQEKAHITENVLAFEPHLALFVPDDDPLLFYKKILIIAQESLNKGGLLAVEINTQLGSEVVDLFLSGGLKNVICKKDFYGKDRFVFAERN